MASNAAFENEDIVSYGTFSRGKYQGDTQIAREPSHEIFPMHGNSEDEKDTAKRKNWLARQLAMQFTLPYHPIVHYTTLALIGLLIWVLLYLFLHKEVLLYGGLFKLLALFKLAYLAGCLVSLIKLPPLLGMLLTGIVLRAVGYFTISGVYTGVVIVLRNLALTVILIKAGLGLDASALLKLKYTVLKLGILPCAGEAVATAVLCYYCLGYPWTWSFLLGWLLSPISPAVVVPTLLSLKEQGYGNDKGISTLVIAASSLDDIFSISMFGVLLSTIFSLGSMTMAMARGPLELLAGLIFGTAWGFVCASFPHRNDGYLVVKRSVILGFGGIVFVLGSIELDYPGAGPLACVTAAFVSNVSWKLQGWDSPQPSPVANVYSKIWILVQPILFGLIGAEIDIRTLNPGQVVNGLAIVLGALAFRVCVCFLTLLGGSLNWKEMIFVNLAWLPKATVQAAFSPQPLDHLRATNSKDEYAYELANFVLTTAVVAIIITAPIGAIAISLTGPYLLNKTEK